MYGYCSGFGANIYLNGYYDTCNIYCSGASCININWKSIGENTNDFSISCANSNDFLYSRNLIRNRNDYSDDYLAKLIDNMPVTNYNYSMFTMLPKNLNCKEINNLTIINENETKKDYIGVNNICNVINYKYNQSYLHETSIHYCTNNILSINGILYCLSREGCEHYNEIGSKYDIYCNGLFSYYPINNLLAGHKIYCNERYSCSWSNIDHNSNIISCEGFAGCNNSNTMNSNIVICRSQANCLTSKITNVWTIIATCYFATCNISQINATNIYLVRTKSCCNANVMVNNNTNNNADIFVDDVKLYCQNDDCSNLTPNSKIYRKDEIKIRYLQYVGSGDIDDRDDNYYSNDNKNTKNSNNSKRKLDYWFWQKC